MEVRATGFTQLAMYLGRGLLSAWLSVGVASAHPMGTEAGHMDKFEKVRYRSVQVDGIKIFYREAGDPKRPSILLLHGFSSSSHMFRDLLPLLSDRFHLIAPDYPGFGYSDTPAARSFNPTFTNLEIIISKFVQAVELKPFILYMQDFGGPVGLRMAVKHPEWIEGLIVQNANAYLEGLSPPSAKQSTEGDKPVKMSTQVVNPEFIHYLYRSGVRDVSALNPDAWTVDIAVLQKPEAKRIQSALIDDYPSNLQQYSIWHEYFKKWQPKTLIVWGKNDHAFTTQGVEAYRKDLKDIEINYFDTGHFALEENVEEIAQAIIQSFTR